MEKKQVLVDPSACILPGAILVGAVTVGAQSSIWYNAVLRGDLSPIRIGARSNIQDCAVLHTGSRNPLVVGDGVTVGHGAILHGCTIGDNTLVGMGAILMNGAEIGRDCIIGAGALILQGTVIPDGMLAMGSPAKCIRALTDSEIAQNVRSCEDYLKLMAESV